MTAGVQIPQKRAWIVERFRIIEDSQERLAAVVERVRKMPPLEESERVETNRVKGCISRVWLVPTLTDGSCHFRVDADSSLVRGLAAVVCELYDGSEPADILADDSDILSELHLIDQLSQTRRHGLAQLRAAIREFAARVGE